MNETTETIEVLHVDDDRSVCSLTAEFLEREDERLAVTTATSADEGLATLDRREVDCVVSDYNMPGMGGLELLRAVREEYPDLPFILFTGKGSEEVASSAIAAGVTDYIRKGSGSEQYELLANRICNAVRARREARRADRQEQLKRLTESAGDTGGFEIDTGTGEVRLSDGARRLLDLPENPALGVEDWLERVDPDDRDGIRQAIDRAIETGKRAHATGRYRVTDGQHRVLEVTFTPPVTDSDSVTLRGAIHDITDRRERRRELETERRFIQQALDTLEDLFYVLDVDGRLRRWNERVPEVTGYTGTELADMHAVDLFPADEREAVADAVEAVVSGERVSLEADLLTAAGRHIPYEFTGARLTDETGDTTGLVGIGRDLTERRRRERRFQALVDDLLTLESEAEGVAESERIELADVAERCWERVETGGATLEIDTRQRVRADRSRLHRLFAGLYRSAIERGDEVTVSVGSAADRFYVADTGPGIPDRVRGEGFETGSSTTGHGPDLCLQIAEQVAEAHGWEGRVTDSETGGARVEVTGVEFVGW